MPTSDFSKLIKDCRSKKLDRLIYNASEDHAIDLFSNLIDEAKVTGEPVRITSGNLRRDFYGSLLEPIQKAMDNGVTVQLAVLDPTTDLTDHPFVKLILSGNGDVYRATKEKIKTPHFILVGGNRFRLETDHKQTKAVACFNNSKIGNILNVQFDNIIELESMERMRAV